MHIKENETIIDRIVRYFSPQKGLERFVSKLRFSAISGGYKSGSKTRRQTRGLTTTGANPDSLIGSQGKTIHERSQYLYNNDGYIAGAIENIITSTSSAKGLIPNSQINNRLLKLSDFEVEKKQNIIEEEFKLFAETNNFDRERTVDYGGFSEIALRSSLLHGDVFFIFGKNKRAGRPYETTLHAVEGIRVSNPNNAIDNNNLIQGVYKDKNGAPEKYYFSNFHPGNYSFKGKRKWVAVNAFGKTTGRPNVIHFFHKLRSGQTRGISPLAPIIEDMVMANKYREIEMMAAAVAGMFTVFIKTPDVNKIRPMEPVDEIGGTVSDSDYKIDGGAIVELGNNEIVNTTTNPGRPNSHFGSFQDYIHMGVGAALEMPLEVFRQKFDASFSASQAAIMMAWQAYINRRVRLVKNFCTAIWTEFFYEMIEKGRLEAPGFFRDPSIRAAYMGVNWIGPPKPFIKELEAVNAAVAKINNGLSTRSEEVIKLSGGDFNNFVSKLETENKNLNKAKKQLEGKN